MLKNVAGNEASLDYENNTATTVNVDGTSRNVKEPYVMASFTSFDTEHPKIIKVNNDKGMNQDGSFVAVVLAMPGLTQSPSSTTWLIYLKASPFFRAFELRA